MILIKNLSKSFQGIKALDNVTMEFPNRETTVILGASGSGKSTILRILTGLESFDQGEIKFRNKSVSKLAHEDFGYVIQEGGLFPHLNIEDNLKLQAKLKGKNHEYISSKTTELLQLMSLPDSVLAKFPNQLSGGQRQRVALARGLFMDPDTLLLDEPLGALDPIIRWDLQQELRDIFQRLNKTVIIVTHDLREASYLSENAYIMNNGCIQQSGQLDKIISSPANDYVRKFTEAHSFAKRS